MRMRAPIAAFAGLSLLLASETAAAQKAPDPDPWWGRDKALHFGLSAGITGGGYAIATQTTDDIGGRAALAASLGIGVGLGKEILDACGLGHPSWKDFLWDVIGTSAALTIAVSIDFGVRAANGGK
jgi:putative lipoprotein